MVFALLVSLAACSPGGYYKDAAQAPMADAMGYAGMPGGGEMTKSAEYSFEESLASESEADYRKNDEAPPAPPTDTTTATGNTVPVGQPGPDQPAPESAERKVVYTASLQVAVFEVPEALAFAEALPDRYGGWVQSRYDTQITLRIPADRLREAIEELSALGMVLGKTLQATDVTAEYTDLESRLTVLEQMEEQLLLLLDQAKTVEESLKIRQELERVRIELELARARMRTLSELIGFSTLTLVLSQRGPITAEIGSNDPFPWVDQLGVEATEYQ
ncbi:DUF4349 domain-containing protein [Nannocystaceae bacterium ST9]